MAERGSRISLGGPGSDDELGPVQHLGTVRYSGPVPPTSGTWLGVEWDDKTRGKHSGVYAQTGVRYFECRVEGAGTFIRPTAKGLSLGRSFVSAIKDRYLGDQPGNLPDIATFASSTAPHSYNSTSTLYSTNFNRQIEVPSLDKISALFRQLDRLTTAGLEYAEVASAGDEAELTRLGEQMSRLSSLNLSFSLLASLGEVDKIAVALPKLDTLLLNANRFSPITEPTNLIGFTRLTRLSLNQTLVSWAEVMHIAPSLGQLRQLELGFNNLTALNPPFDCHSSASQLASLEELNLSGNNLTDWNHLADQLSNLPTLARVVLSNNQLSGLCTPTATAQTPRLTKLRHLDLTNNLIANWSEINPLNVLPALDSVNVGGNALLAGEEEKGGTSRLQLIARLGRITKLEGTQIRPFERDDAERFYLSVIAKDGKLLTEDQRAATHPRYPELVSKHGAVATPEPKPTMRSRLINLRIELPAALAPDDGSSPSVAVLPTLRTMLLRTHIAKLAGRPVPKTKYKLIALLAPSPQQDVNGKKPLSALAPVGKALEVEVPPGEEGRELGFWGLGDGDGVRVVSV